MSEAAENIEVEELQVLQQPLEQNFYNKTFKMTEKLAATRFGQFVMERTDRALRIVENTAKWSLPKDKQGTIMRPLPWFPFLALILILRLLRFWLSVSTLFIGNNPVTAKDMVYFIQTRRRKLRAIRIQGLKCLREKENIQHTSANNGFLQKIFNTMFRAVCSTSRHSQTDLNLEMLRERWSKASVQNSNRQLSKKRSSSKEADIEQNSDEEQQQLSFGELLAKYAEMASDEDSNYTPSESSSDESSSMQSSAPSDAEDDIVEQEEATNGTKMAVIDAEVETKKNKNLIMPKPIDIKIEPASDVDSAKKQKKINGTAEVEDENMTTMAVNSVDVDDENKSTPGHMSAALTKVQQTALLNHTVEAVADIGEHESNMKTSPQSSSKMIEIPTQNLNNSDPAFESPKLGSASSCEDIFYSPIGSPTELNAMVQPFFHNNNVAFAENKDSQLKITENVVVEKDVKRGKTSLEPQHNKQHQKQPHTKPIHHQQEQQHQNHLTSAKHRYRGQYRRRFDAVP